MHPVLLTIGRLQILSYGVWLSAGALSAAIYVAATCGARLGLEDRLKLLVALGLGAMAGSRLAAALLTRPETVRHFARASVSLNSGFEILGALFGAAAAGWAFARNRKLPFLELADALGPAFLLGLAWARGGCLLAGCCFGRPTRLPWGVVFGPGDWLVPPGWRGQALHPTQLYEALACLIGLAFARRLLKEVDRRPGEVFLWSAGLYATARFALDSLRGDYGPGRHVGSVPAIQILSGLTAAACFALLFFALKSGRRGATLRGIEETSCSRD